MVKKIIIYSVTNFDYYFLSKILALLIDPYCDINNKKKLFTKVPFISNISSANLPFYSTNPTYMNYKIIKSAPHIVLYLVKNPLDLIVSKYFYVKLKNKNKYEKHQTFLNVKKDMFNWCIKNIASLNKKIIKHISLQLKHYKSILIDYDNLKDSLKIHIKIISELMNLELNDSSINKIVNDLKKSNEHFKSYKDYFTNKEIILLKKKIPNILLEFFNL